MISHCGAPQRLEQTCPHFVVVINATLCCTSLIHIVGSMVLCQLWISLACAWPPIRLHGDALDSRGLFDRVPVVVMDAARVSGMLSFVMEHVSQTCPRTSWVDFRWGLLTTRRMERLRWSSTATQGTRHSGASSEVRSQGQHTTQVFSIPSDCCNSSQGTSWTSSVAATSALTAMQKSMNLFVILP